MNETVEIWLHRAESAYKLGALNKVSDQENKNIFFTGKQWDYRPSVSVNPSVAGFAYTSCCCFAYEDAQLYYFNARWYDPETGRFITEDPIKDGLNWYSYCSNNPVNRIDPNGLEWRESKGFLQIIIKPNGEAPKEHHGEDWQWFNDETNQPETEGKEIPSVTTGTVTKSEWHDIAGWWVSIDNGDGTNTDYFHLQEESHLEEGDTVRLGDYIGKAGNTGESFGSHSHIQTSYPDTVEPDEPYIDRWGRSYINPTDLDYAQNIHDERLDNARRHDPDCID